MMIMSVLLSLSVHAQSNYQRFGENRDRRETAEKQARWEADTRLSQSRFVRALLSFAASKGGGTNIYCRKYLNTWDPRSQVPICDGANCVQVDSDSPRVGLPQWCEFDVSANEACMVWGASWPTLEIYARCKDARGEETKRRTLARY